MTDLIDETQLRADLATLIASAGTEIPPVTAIEGRVHDMSRRHRNRLLGVGAGAGAALVLAAAGTMHIVGWEAGPTGEVPICTAREAMTGGVEAYGVGVNEVPADIRLGWTAAAGAPEPAYANGRRIESKCENAPSRRLLDIEDGVVVRSLDLVAYPVASDGSTSSDNDPEAIPNDGTSNSGPLDFESFRNGLDVELPRRDLANLSDLTDFSMRRADWTDQGYWYQVYATGFTEVEMADLLADLKVKNGSYGLAGWSGREDMEFDEVEDLPSDGRSYAWILNGGAMPDGQDLPVSLDVDESVNSLWFQAGVGDVVTEVRGGRALQSLDGAVSWKPTPTTAAYVYGSLSPERLLAIAETVEPRPAGDFEAISAF